MDSSTGFHQISDPVFRIWSKQFELIVEDDKPQTSFVQLSIHPESIHNKIWVSSSRSNNTNKPIILREKTESIRGKPAQLTPQLVFDHDMVAYRFVSSMLPLNEIDKFDRMCLIEKIVSTVRKIFEGNSRRTEKVMNKLWVMDLELDVTTIYLPNEEHNVLSEGGKASLDNQLISN